MPTAKLADVTLNYALEGPADAPAIVFSSSLGAELGMWDAQAAALAPHFRVLRYDYRGHGGSSTPPAPYSLAALGGDVVGLLDHCGIARANYCGLSIGGLIGQWLALNAAERFDRFILCSTGAKLGTEESWNQRIEQVRAQGTAPSAASALERWFTRAFAEQHAEIVEAIRAQIERTRPEGYIGCIGALKDGDFRERLHEIRTPTLAIAGKSDRTTPPESLQFIAGRIPGAHYIELAGAHLCNVESAEGFNRALIHFLGEAQKQDRAP